MIVFFTDGVVSWIFCSRMFSSSETFYVSEIDRLLISDKPKKGATICDFHFSKVSSISVLSMLVRIAECVNNALVLFLIVFLY